VHVDAEFDPKNISHDVKSTFITCRDFLVFEHRTPATIQSRLLEGIAVVISEFIQGFVLLT
jgi:hypothetical protein